MLANNNHEELHDCCKEYWEHFLKNNPLFATYIGDHRYDDTLEDLSEQSLSAQNEFYQSLLGSLEKIDETPLNAEDKLNIMLLKTRVSDHMQFYGFRTHFVPLDHMQGPHLDFPQIIEFHPFNTRKDIENYVKRLDAFPRLIDQVIDNFRNGVKTGITAFQKSIEYVCKQVDTFAKYRPEDNPLFAPVKKMGDTFSAEEKEVLQRSVKEAITGKVTPAYCKLIVYLNKEYKKQCREKEGVWALPDGNDLYRFLVKYHTTTDLSPEEIHEIGKKEISRIHREIENVMSQVNFHGSIKEFADYVRKNKALYHKQGDDLLGGYKGILTRMEKKLPDYFGRLPKARYGLKEIEKYREQSAPAAYYYPPPEDFSRPGYFYVNTYKPEQRPKFEMEALAYHEAIPGHHLQIAIMQELENIPAFRRYEGSTAFIEGWALYAEKLAGEMGFYQDIYSQYGRLTFEIWRAVRLVVDTGLHYYQWSRNDCINFFKENTGLEGHEIEVEIDRYIVMPGQALAYKTGELTILELKEKAKKQRGLHFSIKDFHDRLLENGALPLFALEHNMQEWMNSGD